MSTDLLSGSTDHYRLESLERRIEELEAQRLREINARAEAERARSDKFVFRSEGFYVGFFVGAWVIILFLWLLRG